MLSKTTIALAAGMAAVMTAGMAKGEFTAGTLRINGCSGGTSASQHYIIWDPIYPQDYWETSSMPWGLGQAGANSFSGSASADLSVTFWNLLSGGWVESGNPGTITGSASRKATLSNARSWADISFTQTTAFLFSASATGGASVKLSGAASFDVTGGNSLSVVLPAGDYTVSVDAWDAGSYFASIPAPGTMLLGVTGGLLAARRRRAAV